jgi:hypothetical protein
MAQVHGTNDGATSSYVPEIAASAVLVPSVELPVGSDIVKVSKLIRLSIYYIILFYIWSL